MKGWTRLFRSRLFRSNRGAAAVEFVIAVIPLHAAFFGFTQVAHIYTAHLVLKHAALAAGRAAIVIDQKCNPGPGNGSESEIKDAARNALGPWVNTFANLQVGPPQYAGGDIFGSEKTTTTARFKCEVPLGKHIVCSGGFRSMKVEVTLPHQGARYNHAAGGCETVN